MTFASRRNIRCCCLNGMNREENNMDILNHWGENLLYSIQPCNLISAIAVHMSFLWTLEKTLTAHWTHAEFGFYLHWVGNSEAGLLNLQLTYLFLLRCIKPNHSKLPDNFDVKIIADQLRSTGVLETTRIRRLGYSTRISFQMFLLRYSIFTLHTAKPMLSRNGKTLRKCIFLKAGC